MILEMRCPTCGHQHPSGIGASWCGCDDCGLLWTSVPLNLLDETHRQRYEELRVMTFGVTSRTMERLSEE